MEGEENMIKKEIIDAYQFRHACKAFDKTKKISDEDFAFILETARLSPSSFGTEPWRFLLIENNDLKEKLKGISWGAINSLNGASHFLIVLARKQMRYDQGYYRHMLQDVRKMPLDAQEATMGFYKEFQENDFDLLASERNLFDWSSKQTYIAMANMMTAASMIGIDSCPIEGFKKNEVEELLQKENHLDSEAFGVSYMLAFGYRDESVSIRPKTRLPITDIFETI